MWSQIVAIAEKVMSALAPLLSLKYTSVYRHSSPRSRCFQIIGLDILLDNNCKAWLLEVNGNPSLRSGKLRLRGSGQGVFFSTKIEVAGCAASLPGATGMAQIGGATQTSIHRFAFPGR